MKSKLAVTEGRLKEQYVEFIDAIHLQQFLTTKFGGDKKRAKEELQKLLLVEKIPQAWLG